MNTIDTDVQELVEELGATEYKKGISWKGYEVFEPVFKQVAIIGYPFVVLRKGEDVRLSTPKESIEYLHFKNGKKGDA